MKFDVKIYGHHKTIPILRTATQKRLVNLARKITSIQTQKLCMKFANNVIFDILRFAGQGLRHLDPYSLSDFLCGYGKKKNSVLAEILSLIFQYKDLFRGIPPDVGDVVLLWLVRWTPGREVWGVVMLVISSC